MAGEKVDLHIKQGGVAGATLDVQRVHAVAAKRRCGRRASAELSALASPHLAHCGVPRRSANHLLTPEFALRCVTAARKAMPPVVGR